MEEYRYRLTTTGGNSHKYGNCEVCKQLVTEVFQQTEEKKYSLGWTQHNCNNIFGHKECLENKRR